MREPLRAQISEAPIDARALEKLVWATSDGALATFTGVVRNHDGGRLVSSLEYSAHPDAERHLRQVCTEVSDVTSLHGVRVAAAHRLGHLDIGDVAIVVSVAAPHRSEAFDACRVLVDRIKHEVPIWKRQHFEDGSSEWVGAC